MKSNKIFKQYIQIIISFLLLIFAIYKARIGIHSDEIHSIAVGDMISRGNLMFKDCWFYLQLSAVLNAPLTWIFRYLSGSNDGLILYLRIISIFVQASISFFFYKTFKNEKNKFFVYIAAICLFSFVPDFLNFGYKPELIWFTVLEICFAYKYCQSKKSINLIFLGISLSLCVLCFPTTILQVLVWIVFLFVRNKNKNESPKNIWYIPLTCLCCGIVFFIFVFSQISFKEFITFFPEILNDDQLDSSFITKLYKPFIKMIELSVLSILPVILCMKIRFFKSLVSKLKFPVFSFLLIMAFLGQCFIERAGITWHCITYPYSLTMYFLPLIYIFSTNEEKEENRDMFWCFSLMTWISYWCISLASNQNNITCIYAGVFSTCGMLILIGNSNRQEILKDLTTEKNLIAVSLCIMSLLMFIFPVWDQEAIYFERYGMRNIFSDRSLMTEGPAKGIYVSDEMYKRVNDLCDELNQYTTNDDKVYIIESAFYASFGYLHQKGMYATYSPRGHYFDRIKEYYDVNPQNLASTIIISKTYLEEKYDDTFPSGMALETVIIENGYIRSEDENFIIYKLP